MSNYRWIEGIEFIRHGTQSDPELRCDWVTMNYRDVEDAMYEEFEERLDEQDMKTLYNTFTGIDRDEFFERYLKHNVSHIKDYFITYLSNNANT